ncbi:MAG TPA: hypothetical protein VFA41_21235 [Ktedonobacteraceae bacterium]|jgi:hypothetical protein|nr:hypothetical protein [Ktedonobacteraceae bacterium]
MAQEQPGQDAVARAEAALDQLGRRIGLFAAQVNQRVQQAATSIREEADRMDQPQEDTQRSSVEPVAHVGDTSEVASQKAEVIVDRLGQRLSLFAAQTSYQIQKAVARAREEVEDIWAEAENLHAQKSQRP